MSLATKYRPTDFKDLVGQEKVTTILINELKTHTTKQAYLFVGGSGEGKTSSARILANALDSNIIEIDVASNNSAEAMRILVDSVRTRPISYKYTVVILDEFHTISQQASQVLLKIIEQPPKHLIFILCTTEGNKVPQTIYNRCEIFEFVSIGVKQIQQRLKYICEQEQFEFEEQALFIIANMSDGSMRQAISYLEQCSTVPITIESVKKILCADTYDNYLNLVYAVLDGDYETVVRLIKNVYDINKYVAGLFSFVLDISIYNKTKNVKLISIPSIYSEDFDKFTTEEQFGIEKLCEMLLDLQFEGRDNPLLKQLLVASLYRLM